MQKIKKNKNRILVKVVRDILTGKVVFRFTLAERVYFIYAQTTIEQTIKIKT